jgi:PPOX class probable F420-dependent enzyme
MILDLSKPKHAAAQARLHEEPIAWLTTVNPAGQPQSTPIWFLWDGDEFVIYGSKSGPKTPNIKANPHVSLHLEGDSAGGGIVIFEGTARIDETAAGLDGAADYLAKYGDTMKAYGWTPEGMAKDYPHVIRVIPTRVRIW